MLDLPPRPNLSVKDVAVFLGISQQKVYEMVAEGCLPSKRVDRVIRIPRAEFADWWKAIPSASQMAL